MSRLKQLTALPASNPSVRAMGQAARLSVGAVSGYLRAVRTAGIFPEEAERLPETELERRVFGPTPPGKPLRPVVPDCAWIHTELKHHRYVTLQLRRRNTPSAMEPQRTDTTRSASITGGASRTRVGTNSSRIAAREGQPHPRVESAGTEHRRPRYRLVYGCRFIRYPCSRQQLTRLRSAGFSISWLCALKHAGSSASVTAKAVADTSMTPARTEGIKTCLFMVVTSIEWAAANG